MIYNEILERLKHLSLPTEKKGIYELEVRFNSVTEDIFEEVISSFSSFQFSEEKSTDFFFENKRYSIFSDGSEKCLKKTPIFKSQSDFYDYRISLAFEEEEECDITGVEISHIREKFRKSIFFGSARLDLTSIVSYSPKKENEKKISYEIEVEVTSLSLFEEKNLLSFSEIVEKVYCIVRDSDLITLPEEKEIVEKVCSLLNETEGNNFFAQARNIKPKDLISGEVCFNSRGMTVSPKADGERRLLCSLPFKKKNSIFLLNLNKRGYSIQLKNSEGENPSSLLVDGEYLKSKNLFLCFDCLYSSRDTRDESYLLRLQKMREAVSKLSSSLIIKEKIITTIFTKEDYLSSSFKEKAMQHFFDCVNSVLDSEREYPTDGLMFTPIDCGYSDLTKIKKGKLSEVVAILKWKPPEKLTIDFELGNGKKLFSSGGDKKILFTAKEYSFLKNVNWDSIFSSGAVNGDIIELSPNFDRGYPLLSFERFRRDKVKSNNINVARDVWDDITSPLTEDIIRGRTLYLVRKYHNTIKRYLFERVASSNEDNYLIDIGSGRGGDLTKWKKYSKIFCIEPSEENLTEFKRRLRELSFSGDERKIKIVKYECCDGYFPIVEDIKRFFGFTKVKNNLVISMMLSLSFFWRDETTLNTLAKFIKEITTVYHSLTGKSVIFTFLTILGEEMNLVVPPHTERELNDALVVNNGKKVFINIKNSIVRDQTEYYVYLPQLLSKVGYSIEEFEISNRNPFLSSNEKIYTSMYGSGIWKSGKDSIYLSPGSIEKIEIDGDEFLLNGVGRSKNLTEVLSFFTNLKGYIPEGKSLDEIATHLKRDIYVVSEGDEVVVYSPGTEEDESIPIILYRLPDGIYYALTEK